jgi:hypothetical protein
MDSFSSTGLQPDLAGILVSTPALALDSGTTASTSAYDQSAALTCTLLPKPAGLLDVIAIPSPLLPAKAALLLDVWPPCVSGKAISVLDAPGHTSSNIIRRVTQPISSSPPSSPTPTAYPHIKLPTHHGPRFSRSRQSPHPHDT